MVPLLTSAGVPCSLICKIYEICFPKSFTLPFKGFKYKPSLPQLPLCLMLPGTYPHPLFTALWIVHFHSLPRDFISSGNSCPVVWQRDTCFGYGQTWLRTQVPTHLLAVWPQQTISSFRPPFSTSVRCGIVISTVQMGLCHGLDESACHTSGTW